MTKDILFNDELRVKVLKGVNVLADAVGATLGPKGRTVIIKDKNKKPVVTKDGVTVARSITLKDHFENLGAEVVKQAAESTVAVAGDGTSTSTVLTRAILNKAQSFISSGDSPLELTKGMNKAVDAVLQEIEVNSMPIRTLEEVEQIASISANDKSIGSLIKEAVDKIGKDGAITVQDGKSSDTILELSEGFTFDSGLLANAFINDERRSVMRHEDCLVLVTDKSITTVDDMLPALTLVARDGRALIIIAENVDNEALAACVMNAVRGNMKVAAIKAPRYGEERRNILEDIALVTGAKFITRESGINFKKITIGDFGTAKIVESNRFLTTIVSHPNEEKDQQIQTRIDALKELIKSTDDMKVCERIQERITRLSSGIAVIKVGGSTEAEMIERKHRIEDALEAIKAAQEGGLVPGGGTTLVKASKVIDKVIFDNPEQQRGGQIIQMAIMEPFKKIVSNAGLSPDVFINTLIMDSKDWNFGYDMSNNGEACNLIEKGIIDPFKVVKFSLKNAVSAASMLIMSSVAIVEE